MREDTNDRDIFLVNKYKLTTNEVLIGLNSSHDLGVHMGEPKEKYHY